jgi:large subunit ribosomal protein L36
MFPSFSRPILSSTSSLHTSTATTTNSRTFSALSWGNARRPQLRVQGEVEGKVVGKGVQEQVRGMKVRSSVKKLCEGCKVCFLLLGVRRGVEWGVDGGGCREERG